MGRLCIVHMKWRGERRLAVLLVIAFPFRETDLANTLCQPVVIVTVHDQVGDSLSFTAHCLAPPIRADGGVNRFPERLIEGVLSGKSDE